MLFIRFAENGVQRLINPLLHINYIFDRTKYGKESRRNLKILHSFTDKVSPILGLRDFLLKLVKCSETGYY